MEDRAYLEIISISLIHRFFSNLTAALAALSRYSYSSAFFINSSIAPPRMRLGWMWFVRTTLLYLPTRCTGANLFSSQHKSRCAALECPPHQQSAPLMHTAESFSLIRCQAKQAKLACAFLCSALPLSTSLFLLPRRI